MEHTTLFKSNRSQAVRLPKAIAFPDDVREVSIIKAGKARIIVPADAAWDVWFDGPDVSADFMSERDQPQDQQRESF